VTRRGRTAGLSLVLSSALLLAASTPGLGSPKDHHPAGTRPTPAARDTSASRPDDRTWVDHDGRPIPQPPDWDPDFLGHVFREAAVEPLSHAFDIPDKMLLGARALGAHPQREALDVNAFDEVPNSTWFTNRNHLRAVPVAELRMGPDSTTLPSKPWTITHRKQGGASTGFQIKDAAGRKWLLKLEPRGYVQLCTGADMVARTLLHASGYNVPHNEAVRFRREDLTISKDLARGAKGERLTEAELDSMLAGGGVYPDGENSALASLYLSGHVLGSFSSFRRRPGDRNDWYRHPNRRELRGLYVISSWIGCWDTKDANFLDTFIMTRDSLGHVDHYFLDPGSSFGADARGPKRQQDGFEGIADFGWMARRLVTLGFVTEPWRRARQDTGIPSIGRFESAVFDPGAFVPGVPDLSYHYRTAGDDYWGAKIVASFSDAQIGAAVDAAHYEDPRAREFLVRALIVRRDKIARYWFARVAPLDFFSVEDGTLRFHDLAVDIGIAGPRGYEAEIESEGGPGPAPDRVRLRDPDLPLRPLGTTASRVSIQLSIAGSGAKPVHIQLARKGLHWTVARVRHG